MQTDRRTFDLRAAGVTIVALAALAVASDASAQRPGYGVKGGVTLATLSVDADDGAAPLDQRAGLVAGGFLARPFGRRLTLQLEVLFARKGASAEEGGGTSTQKLDYLDVPVLLGYRLAGAPERHVQAFVGPAFAVRIRARSSASFGGDTLEQDVSDEVKRTDLAIVGGLAYHRGRLVMDGRYSWGVMDVDREVDDEVTVHNRGVSFLLGWTF